MVKQVCLRLDDDLLREVDVARGGVPRNLWLVAAVKVALGHDLRRGLSETGPGWVERSPVLDPGLTREVSPGRFEGRRHRVGCGCPVCKS